MNWMFAYVIDFQAESRYAWKLQHSGFQNRGFARFPISCAKVQDFKKLNFNHVFRQYIFRWSGEVACMQSSFWPFSLCFSWLLGFSYRKELVRIRTSSSGKWKKDWQTFLTLSSINFFDNKHGSFSLWIMSVFLHVIPIIIKLLHCADEVSCRLINHGTEKDAVVV